MIKDQCISVTDLRTKTKECLAGIDKAPKYIFINNKPTAVLLDIDTYEEMTRPQLIELNKDQVTQELIKEAQKAKKISKSDLLDI
ncbi:hypothetical protein COU74_02560 [Candidatus Peregrinibacteria bacterium CG10_big_fil_rev_8_21_14_0_10_36_19]|nr:MAG: hypothetical protein COU74_02560 [Candidatus Peregrinibacteria bacterium CG10_big_fil_rev_8_21_14_0_10_36_19]